MGLVDTKKAIVRIDSEEARELKKEGILVGNLIRMYKTCPKISGSFVLKKDEDGYYLEFSFEG